MKLDPRRHLSHGFYRVSDREAGALARELGEQLPPRGMELRGVIVNNTFMTLIRTPLSPANAAAYDMIAPKRGWVWSVYALQGAPPSRAARLQLVSDP